MEIQRIAGSLGAEVQGINLRQLNKTEAQKVHEALLEHKVLVFRNAGLNPTELLKFSKLFGHPTTYPFQSAGVDGHPEIMEVLKTEEEVTNFGGKRQ